MAWEYDKFKAQMLFTHLLRASHKYAEHHMAKEELADSLKKISKFKVNKEFKKEIKLLKDKINTLVEKETQISQVYKKHKTVNTSLRHKIEVLEKKLTQYIEDKKKKNKRIEELEQKIKAREQKREAFNVIKGELEGLETIYESLKESGHLTPLQLKKLESRISLLKVKMQSMEK